MLAIWYINVFYIIIYDVSKQLESNKRNQDSNRNRKNINQRLKLERENRDAQQRTWINQSNTYKEASIRATLKTVSMYNVTTEPCFIILIVS